MKGQQDVLSAILISGILIGVVSSVYLWGVPLIQKNRDIAVLKNTEDFMNTLNQKIKDVANNGGRDQIIIDIPGIVEIRDGVLEAKIDTQGTIYATEAEIPLGRNDCTRSEGTWGVHESSVNCVKSEKIDEGRYVTTNFLRYIKLNINEGSPSSHSFEINVIGTATGGEDRTISIENLGVEQGDATTANIRVDIL